MTIERELVETPVSETHAGTGITRRALLKGLGAGALTVVVGGVAVGSYRCLHQRRPRLRGRRPLRPVVALA
jgi:hypothetical protein